MEYQRRGEARNPNGSRAAAAATARAFLSQHYPHPHTHHQLQLPTPPPPPAYQHLQHHHHRLPSSLPAISDNSSRLFHNSLQSRSAVSVDHGDYASILAYRERLNGSGIVPQLPRTHGGGVASWGQGERHGSSDLHRISIDDDSRFRQAIARELQENRDDLRRSDLFLPELDNSRRSAVLSAKLFLDERRHRASTYHDGPPAVELQRGRVEREHADDESAIFRTPQRLRKRSRDAESDIENGRASKHKRFRDPGLAVLPGTPEGPPLYRRVLSSSTSRMYHEVDDRQNDQVFSSSDKQRLATTSSANMNKKELAQVKPPQANVNRSILQRLGSSPKSESKLPQRETDTRKHGANEKRGFPNSSGKKGKPGSGGNQKFSRFENLELANVQKKVKKVQVGTVRTPTKGQDDSGKANLDKKGRRLSEPGSQSFSIVEAKPRRSLKSRFSRVSVSDAKVCGSLSKSKSVEKAIEKHMARELRFDCKASVVANDVEKIDKTLCPEHVSDDSATGSAHTKKLITHQINQTNVHGQIAAAELRPLELRCQNVITGSHYMPESPHSLGDFSVRNLQACDASEASKQQDEADPLHCNNVNNVSCKTSGYSATLLSCPEELVSIGLRHKDDSAKETFPPEERAQIAFIPLELHSRQVKDSNNFAKDSLLPVILNSPLFLEPAGSFPQCFESPRLTNTDPFLNARSQQGAASGISSFSRDASLPSAHLTGCLERSSPQAISQNTQTPTPVSCNWAGDASIESGFSLADPKLNFVQATKATTAEREVRLFGKSLKATMTDIVSQGVVATTVTTSKQDVWTTPVTALDSATVVTNAKPDRPKLHESLAVTMEAAVDLTSMRVTAPPGLLPESQGTVAVTTDSGADRTIIYTLSTPDLSLEQPATLAEPLKKVAATETDHPPATAMMKEETSFALEVVGPEKLKPETYPLGGQGRQLTHASGKQIPMVTTHQSPRGRVHTTPVRTGAHTWRRPPSNFAAVSNVPKPASTLSQVPLAGNQKSSELTSYVRKGNSLVRASITPSSRGVGPLLGPGKDGAGGKSFSSFSRASRNYPGFQNAIKNTKAAFRQVFSDRLISANVSAVVSSTVDNSAVEQQALNSSSVHDGQNTCLPQLLTNSTRPVTPEKWSSTQSLRLDEITLLKSHADDGTSNVNSVFGEPVDPMPAVAAKPKLPPVVQPNACAPKVSESGSTIYVKSKANQLVASLPSVSLVPATPLMLSGALTQGLYYNKKGNQLVRNTVEAKDVNISQLHGSSPEGAHTEALKGPTHTELQTNLGKVLKKRSHVLSSRVWTLKSGPTSQAKSVLPLLFPWKRHYFRMTVGTGKFKAFSKVKKGSLLSLISKKLQRSRKVQPVYTRSADGFALRRSGVLGLSGANLKWTKSIEKRSKQASEEATKAVAAVEKRRREEKAVVGAAKTKVYKRGASSQTSRGNKMLARERIITVGLVRYKMDASRRTLQRLPDQWYSDSGEVSSPGNRADSTFLSTPRRLSIGGTEYVRVGNGHQLVRDPKAATRALASEKVRWSLHSARFRRAKKQQYCLFYTRFGKCNKREGECPYIHDPEKVAVCTKFLKGTCSGTNCLFSHKVVPERMPDCLFFLEGLCTNENCAYRHVSVNPSAQICEGFLKGFCGDGDQCDKKHTLVCPTFASTGDCAERETCKLHHPKKKGKRILCPKSGKFGTRKKRRYFLTGGLGLYEQVNCLQNSESGMVNDESAEFIALPNVEFELDETDEFKKKLNSLSQLLPSLQEDTYGGDLDLWTKPVLLLQQQVDAH